MLSVTNPHDGEIELPTLGLVVGPDETIDVADEVAESLALQGWTPVGWTPDAPAEKPTKKPAQRRKASKEKS